MGILNLTANSFYDGGKNNSIKQALSHTAKMIEQGAFFIDVGAVSSKPGSTIINPKQEKEYLLPILDELIKHFPDTYFSIDTYNSSVAKASLDLGASMINDISGGCFDDQMFPIVGSYNVPYVMMHMRETPRTMQENVNYKDVVQEVACFFSGQIKKANACGIHDLFLDPGFGFGKNKVHNYLLLKNLNHFKSLNYPILMGVSRKSMIYKTLGFGPDEALNGTTALHAWGLERGAKILRAHDVKEAKECIDLCAELQ